MRKFDAVFIDIDDTILDFTKCSYTAVRKSFNDFNYAITDQDYDDFFKKFMVHNLALWHDVELGLLEKSELHRTRFSSAFEKFGIDGLVGTEFEKRYRVHLANASELVTNADEFLSYLSARYPLFTASNAPHNQQLVRLTASNLIGYFTDIYTSELVGSEKPKKAFFDECFNRASAKLGFTLLPSNCVMIGDSLSADIKGGNDYGMVTVWFNIYKNDLLDGYHPDFTIDSLLEIKNIL